MEMMFEIHSPFNEPIKVYRKHDGAIVMTEKIKFIKLVRETTQCSLKEAKDFSDNFLSELIKLQRSNVQLINEIHSEINQIKDWNELVALLNYVKSVYKDLPAQRTEY